MQDNQLSPTQLTTTTDVQKLKAQITTGRTLWIVAVGIFLLYLTILFYIILSDSGLWGVVLFFITMPVPFVAGTMFVIGMIISLSAGKKIAEVHRSIDMQ